LERRDGTAEKGTFVGVKGYFGNSVGDEKTALVFGSDKMPRLRELKRKHDPSLYLTREVSL
jgi:hypothetical protein